MAISLNTNFKLGAGLPLDERMYLTVAQMTEGDPSYIDERIYPDYALIVGKDDGKLYIFSKNGTPKFTEFVGGNGDSPIQEEVMPVPSIDYENKVVQYIGATTADYTQGYFYICSIDDEGNYNWNNLLVQDTFKLTYTDPAVEAKSGDVFVYTGTTTDDFVNGSIYETYTEDDTLKFRNIIYNAETVDAKLALKQGVFQVDTEPTADTEVPNPFQYTGETTDNFISGHFYKKLDDGTFSEVYDLSVYQLKLTGTEGQFVRFNVDGNPVAEDVVLGDKFQEEVMPVASIDYENKVVQYIGSTDDTYTQGYFYICSADDEGNYNWNNILVQNTFKLTYTNPTVEAKSGDVFVYMGTTTDDFINGSVYEAYTEDDTLKFRNIIYNAETVDAKLALKQEIFQEEVMPVADETTVNKVVQYIGATDEDYTFGYWYVGVKEGTDPDFTYSWVNIATQAETPATKVGYSDPDTEAKDGDVFIYTGTTNENFITGNFYKAYLEADVLKFEVLAYGKEVVDQKQQQIQFKVMPEASEDTYGKVYQYIGATNDDFIYGYWYEGMREGVNPDYTYSWKAIVNSSTGDTIQYEILPPASVDNLGAVYQYIGATNATYKKGHFYEVIQNALGDYEYQEISYGNEGSSTLTENITATVAVGGVAEGTTFLVGDDLTTIMKSLLVKYVGPLVQLGTASPKLVEVGTVLNDVELEISVTKKSEPIVSVVLNDETGELQSFSNVENGGSFTYNVASIDFDKTFTVVANDGKSNVSKSLTFNFVNPYYYGESMTNDITADMNIYTKLIETKGTKSVTFDSDNEYLVFMYPATYSDLKSIKDENGFETIDAWTKRTVDINGVSYTAYVSNTLTTINIKYTFEV